MTTTEMIRHGSAAFEAVPSTTRRVLAVLAACWDTLERAGQRRAAAELGRLAEWAAHDEARSVQFREAAAACREAVRASRPSSTTPGSHR